MAITINGSGRITGVSVGGLPDGIVDSDMLAGLTDSDLPSGSVIQVVQDVSNTTQTTIATSGIWTDVSSISITPTSSSNKIKVTCVCPIGIYGTSAQLRGSPRLLRDGSSVWNVAGYVEMSQVRNATDEHNALWCWSFVDSPATTSSVTYKVQGRLHTGSALYFFQASRGYNLICEEIVG